ncbi:MAG: His/Gly/Thr/Pro-type tRNA ligase C-terminal domain-containing protein [Patescibacteria group bacterium]
MIRESIPADELFQRAGAIGQYYGFIPLSALTMKRRGAVKKYSGLPETLTPLSLDPVAETVASFLKHMQQSEVTPSIRQPLFVWHTNITPGRPAPKRALIQFHALGSDRALSEVLIIRALIALVRDLYHEEPVVRINSMGDKETRARYARELGNFFKKRTGTLPEECVSCAKRDALEAAELVIEQECGDDLPAPTEHLSDASRKRFEDLLEYLEMTETPYELARTLLSRGPLWSDTCFEVTANGQRLAWGSRYNDLTRHFFPSATMHASGAVFQVPTSGAIIKKHSSPRLRFSFVHIGDEAKRLSLKLAEDFRKARIGLTQDIGVESLTEQLHLAERRGSPYLLIMGRKEALEGSAILRNRATQQEVVLPLVGIIDRLKAVA